MSENLNKNNIKDEFEILSSTKNVNKIDNLQSDKETKALKKLGLPLDSSLQDIKRRYKILVKKYHPDTNINKKKSNNILIEINEAYKILLTTINQ